MATTSTNLTAGKAIAGQAGDGKGYKGRTAGLVATAALGVALLTGMVFSQARQAAPPAAGPAASSAQAGGAEWQLFLEQNTQLPIAGTLVTQGAEQQLFLGQNLTLPSGTLPSAATTYEQFLYVERNFVLPAGTPAMAVATSEQQRFLEQNLALPSPGVEPAEFHGNGYTER